LRCIWSSQKNRKADFNKISGTLQNDILKEYIAQKEWIYPIKPAMKLVIDTFEYTTKHVPKYNPISISGYHIREAGRRPCRNLRSRCATASSTCSTASIAD
jgi:methylmalonyl-CoA mutase N-terminal domain/subunit